MRMELTGTPRKILALAEGVLATLETQSAKFGVEVPTEHAFSSLISLSVTYRGLLTWVVVELDPKVVKLRSGNDLLHVGFRNRALGSTRDHIVTAVEV